MTAASPNDPEISVRQRLWSDYAYYPSGPGCTIQTLEKFKGSRLTMVSKDSDSTPRAPLLLQVQFLLLLSDPATPSIYAMSTLSVTRSMNLNLNVRIKYTSFPKINKTPAGNNLNLEQKSQIHFKIILNAEKRIGFTASK